MHIEEEKYEESQFWISMSWNGFFFHLSWHRYFKKAVGLITSASRKTPCNIHVLSSCFTSIFYPSSCSFVDCPNQILIFFNEEYKSILIMLSRIEDGPRNSTLSAIFFSHYSGRHHKALQFITNDPKMWVILMALLNGNCSSLRNFVPLITSNSISSFPSS